VSYRKDVLKLYFTDTYVVPFDENNGFIKISHLGVIGYVCDTNFTDTDASVTCRGLGYDTGIGFCCYSWWREENLLTPMWIANVTCKGDEASLLDCEHSGYGNHYWTDCNYRHVAGAVCYMTDDEYGESDIS